MDTVGIKPGMVIGEAGAGDGYFTFHLSKRVGDKGLIYANDIDEDELEELKERAEREGVKNIKIIVGEEKDPLFPKDKSLDMVIMVLVFHHLDDHVTFFKNLIPSLKPGAPVVIVDRDPDKYGGNYSHFYTEEKTKKYMEETDFKLERVETFLERDYILIYCLPQETL
jgi:ubiquinone/menaquinone biosynthesis C-methylase UbiE